MPEPTLETLELYKQLNELNDYDYDIEFNIIDYIDANHDKIDANYTQDRSLLHKALSNRLTRVSARLMEMGAKINESEPMDYIEKVGFGGYIKQTKPRMNSMLDHGFPREMMMLGLCHYVSDTHKDLLLDLLKKRATEFNINATYKSATGLIILCKSYEEIDDDQLKTLKKMVRILIDHGADPTIRDMHNKTAMDYLQETVYNPEPILESIGLAQQPTELLWKTLPTNAVDSILLTPIENGQCMVDFHGESEFGRYYTKQIYDAIVIPKKHPFNLDTVIRPSEVTYYRARIV